jgi:hypothetical protein
MAERKSTLLRLDPAVHDALAQWAKDDQRSTNAQIEYLLRRALAEARLPLKTRTSVSPDNCGSRGLVRKPKPKNDAGSCRGGIPCKHQMAKPLPRALG